MKRVCLFATAVAATAALTTVDAIAADKVGLGAGDFLIRARGIAVIPDESSSVSVIGGEVDASTEYVPEVDFSYFLTDNIAFELIAATDRHSVKDKNSALGEVNLGKVSLLPPILTVQWHFLPRQSINPYVGAGINYTIFYNEKAGGGAVQNIKYDDGFGWALQVGVDIHIAGGWFANVDVKKLFLNTDVSVNSGAIQADVDLDPWIVGVGVGYRF